MKATLAAPHTSAASSLSYMPGLDVLRGIAILMVLLDHGLAMDLAPHISGSTHVLGAVEAVIRYGHMGVHLFFILSGFLITGILLDSRTQTDYFRNFYSRRALRILPAYLLMLAVLVATHSITARYVAVYLLFLCNMPGLLGASPEYSPLWSLSVEEQFYLVWPLVVRRLSMRGLAMLCAAVILLTPVLRFGLLHGPIFLQDVRFKTWAVADFFAAGALLAMAARYPHLRRMMHTAVAPLIVGGLVLFALQRAMGASESHVLVNLNHATYLEPWLLGLSGVVLFGFLHPTVADCMAGRALVFLAKISYGLYLCHVFLFNLIDRHWHVNDSSSSGVLAQIFARFMVEAGIAIAVAALSRYTVEQFFLRMKPKHSGRRRVHNAAEKIT